jgi:flavin-dependent dehydrogenase
VGGRFDKRVLLGWAQPFPRTGGAPRACRETTARALHPAPVTMTSVDVDLLVVGGGPIGLATAVEGVLAGLSVAVVERRGTPVDKACGEGLMPAARTALDRLGVEAAGREFVGIRYVAPGRDALARFRRGPGLGVRRTALSAALSARADVVGVKRLDVAAGTPTLRPDGVELAGVTASWLVAADGLHSPLRRALGLHREPPPRTRVRYGLRRHYRMTPWSDVVEVHWSGRAEAYVTPVAEDLVGVAVLGPGDGTRFDDWLGEFPRLRERIAGAEPASAVRGAGPLRQRARRHVSGRALLVGDAAGYVDALTGEGLSVGLACARELVRCVVEGRPEDYERAWRRATRRYRVLTGALLFAAQRSPLRRTIVPAAQRLPWAFERIVDQLG